MKTLFYLLTWGVCLFIAIPATAQILNVEKDRLEGDSTDYFLGAVGLQLNLNNRASTPEKEIVFTQFKVAANAAYIGDNHDYILLGDLDYNTVTDGPLISTGYGHYRVHWLKKHTLSYETFTQFQYDQGRGLELRYLVGGGVRLSLVDNKNTSLHLGVGGMYEYERWEVPESEPRFTITKNLLKSSNYLSYRQKISKTTDFNMITYYQVGYDPEDNIYRNRVSGEANLILKISEKLNFTTSFTCGYDQNPVVDIRKFVYELTNGIQFRL
ncbi:DUF481 domain-containing protein [Roseivirga sp. BDSF3-8]|uniref:DUF481 domain-containing protein n=1 Tax=Roseivirga sp. BDSF3-8 TaxID=3241598 RepID=UPI003532054C